MTQPHSAMQLPTGEAPLAQRLYRPGMFPPPQLLLPAPTMLSCRIPFSGFYYSTWDQAQDSEVEQTISNWSDEPDRRDEDLGTAGVPADIVKTIMSNIGDTLSDVTDNAAYRREVAEAYADDFAWWVADKLGIPNNKETTSSPVAWDPARMHVLHSLPIPFEYEEMTSPAYYNFETDRLFGKFSETTLAMMYAKVHTEYAVLGDRMTPLVQAFRDMFTSRPGFCSFYDGDVPHKLLTQWDHNELYCLLSCWVEQQLGDYSLENEMYDELYETCSNAASNAIDWSALKDAVAHQIADELADVGIDPASLPPPRCTETLPLPL